MTRRYHGLGSYILFIVLVKAFESVNHEIMYREITKFGVPKSLVNIIKMRYPNCSSEQTSVSKGKESIEYGARVLQGNNMAPTLFLFIMQATTDTFKSLLNLTKVDSDTANLLMIHQSRKEDSKVKQ